VGKGNLSQSQSGFIYVICRIFRRRKRNLIYNWSGRIDDSRSVSVSIQFSRSMRSLRLDSFRATRIGLAFAIFIMLALIVWFFVAKVTLYEVSTSLEVNADGKLMATFPKEARPRLRPGMPAILRLTQGTDQPTLTLPAVVFDLPRDGEQVEILVISNALPLDSQQGELTGQVDVEVEYITPAELVLRTSGKFLNRSQVPVSPQTPQD
jgi:hypothetical protein